MKKSNKKKYVLWAISAVIFLIIFFTLKLTGESKEIYLFILSSFIIAGLFIGYIFSKKYLFIRLAPYINKYTKTSLIIFVLLILSTSSYNLFRSYDNIVLLQSNILQLSFRSVSIFGVIVSLFFLYRIIKNDKYKYLRNEIITDSEIEIIKDSIIESKGDFEIEAKGEKKPTKKTLVFGDFGCHLKDETLWGKILNHEEGKKYFYKNGLINTKYKKKSTVAASFMHFLKQNNLFKNNYSIEEQVEISRYYFGVSSSIEKEHNRDYEIFKWILDLK